jgi:hypothetical protein
VRGDQVRKALEKAIPHLAKRPGWWIRVSGSRMLVAWVAASEARASFSFNLTRECTGRVAVDDILWLLDEAIAIRRAFSAG